MRAMVLCQAKWRQMSGSSSIQVCSQQTRATGLVLKGEPRALEIQALTIKTSRALNQERAVAAVVFQTDDHSTIGIAVVIWLPQCNNIWLHRSHPYNRTMKFLIRQTDQ